EVDPHAGIQERELPQTLGQHLVVELDVREDLRARPEPDEGAPLLSLTDYGQGRRRLTQVVFLLVDLAVAIDGELEVVRESVDDRDADAVESARDLVRSVVELTARVQYGHNDFGGGSPLFGMDVDRNPAAVVRHRDGLIRVDRHDDPIAIASQGFVD